MPGGDWCGGGVSPSPYPAPVPRGVRCSNDLLREGQCPLPVSTPALTYHPGTDPLLWVSAGVGSLPQCIWCGTLIDRGAGVCHLGGGVLWLCPHPVVLPPTSPAAQTTPSREEDPHGERPAWADCHEDPPGGRGEAQDGLSPLPRRWGTSWRATQGCPIQGCLQALRSAVP